MSLNIYLGQPTGWTWAFTTTSPKLAGARSYDAAGRTTATEFASYAYDAAGQITSVTQNLWRPGSTSASGTNVVAGNVTFTAGYDALGRLISFDAPASPGPQLVANSAAYAYDANGNRISSSRTQGSTSTSRSYSLVANSNRLAGFSQSSGATTTSVTYGYDANGQQTTNGLGRFYYDARQRLSSMAQGATDTSAVTRYAHNALGQRVFKTEALFPTQGTTGSALTAFQANSWSPGTVSAEQLGYAFAYDEAGTLLAEVGMGGATSAGTTLHVYLPTAAGPMPIAAIINGTRYAVHADHLNTPRKITAANGTVLWQWSYSGFGEDEPTTANKRFTSATTNPTTGTTAATAITYNLRYPGQLADKESGLFYNYFRSYDPRTGRYSQGDPIGLDGGWNRFGYANASPLGFTDPYGLQVGLLIRAGATALGIGALMEASRPKGMSRLEERQFDRHCSGTEDPCSALKDAARRAIEDARSKMNNMLNDKTLFRNAYSTPNPVVTKSPTTWLGHKADLEGRINNIASIISLGKKMGCDMTLEELAAQAIYLPFEPLTP